MCISYITHQHSVWSIKRYLIILQTQYRHSLFIQAIAPWYIIISYVQIHHTITYMGVDIITYYKFLYLYRLLDPCQQDGVRCEPAYSFRHSLNLTSNAALFAVCICMMQIIIILIGETLTVWLNLLWYYYHSVL